MNSPLRDFSARKSRGERAGGEAINGLGNGTAVVSEGAWFQNQAFESWRFECMPIHPPQARSSRIGTVRPETVRARAYGVNS